MTLYLIKYYYYKTFGYRRDLNYITYSMYLFALVFLIVNMNVCNSAELFRLNHIDR